MVQSCDGFKCDNEVFFLYDTQITTKCLLGKDLIKMFLKRLRAVTKPDYMKVKNGILMKYSCQQHCINRFGG